MKKVDTQVKSMHLRHSFLYLATFIWFFVLWFWSIESVDQKYEPLRKEPIVIETKQVEYLTDVELSQLYSGKEEIRNDTCISISVDDAQRLMGIAKAEDGTSAESQAYIMAVILNRVKSPDFPNTIKEVIEQPGQFSADYDEPDVNSHIALAMVESGEIKTDALYFEADWLKGSWQSENKEYLFTCASTKFYR